ncbi:hypothetical protein BD410DRAFT_899929 [Rickenella mellea]|uniref:DUF6534 domain-containing protein n=1 Tax=Rickenella mellea TaxID=50990 RepID=A0A4Y7PY20_9AGAM|nr:hypothetical protein BD410DRAFT_899929 [Rickenella mellea]
MAAPAPVVINLSLSFGPILIGTFIAVAFWGAQCIQTFCLLFHEVRDTLKIVLTYLVLRHGTSYPKDSTLLKAWVLLLLGLDTAHTMVSIKGIWFPLIQGYGDYVNLFNIIPELVYYTMFNAIVAFMAQCYFVRRIYIFSTKKVFKWVIPAILAPPIVWQLVGTIIYTARGLSLKTSAQLSSLSKIASGINSSAAAVDLAITISMCSLLYLSRNGIPSTDRLLGWLIISSLNTGAWTALFAIITVILVTTRPNDLLYAITYPPLCALYCNTILGNLTSRNFLRNAGDVVQMNSVPLHPMSFRGNSQLDGQFDKIHTLGSTTEDTTSHETKSHTISGEFAV